MNKWLHISGVSGKITSKIAILFQQKGWFVTGSDVQYFPPASTVLEQEKVPTVKGYNYKHLTKEFWEHRLGSSLDIPKHPTRMVIVESATNKNKEYLFAKKNDILVQPYSQLMGEFLVKEESIVVVGTAGKTTTTGLITHMLTKLGENPTFLVGGDVLTLDSFLKDTNSRYSVFEGDEYHNPDLSNGAKFLEYAPRYVVITNIGWEHQDIFPTKDLYVEAFKKLVQLVPKDGVIVAKANDSSIDKVLEHAKCKILRFDFGEGPYVQVSAQNESFKINKEKEEITGKYALLGKFNVLNFAAAILLLSEIPSIAKSHSIKEIVTASASYKGVKKRLEVILKKKKTIVIDDFAPAPNRVKTSLAAIKESFPDKRIIAVYEPNSGSRVKNESVFAEMYTDSFVGASTVLVPALSEFNEALLNSAELVEGISALHPRIEVLELEERALLNFLLKEIEQDQNCVVVFYSSYRLEKIQKEFVEKL